MNIKINKDINQYEKHGGDDADSIVAGIFLIIPIMILMVVLLHYKIGVPVNVSVFISIILAFPVFLFGFVTVNGESFRKIIINMWKVAFSEPLFYNAIVDIDDKKENNHEDEKNSKENIFMEIARRFSNGKKSGNKQ